mgnify:CR=1 FL=1
MREHQEAIGDGDANVIVGMLFIWAGGNWGTAIRVAAAITKAKSSLKKEEEKVDNESNRWKRFVGLVNTQLIKATSVLGAAWTKAAT